MRPMSKAELKALLVTSSPAEQVERLRGMGVTPFVDPTTGDPKVYLTVVQSAMLGHAGARPKLNMGAFDGQKANN